MSDGGTSAFLLSAPASLQSRIQRIRRVMVNKTVNDFMPTTECDRILGGIVGISVSGTSISQAHGDKEVIRLVSVSFSVISLGVGRFARLLVALFDGSVAVGIYFVSRASRGRIVSQYIRQLQCFRLYTIFRDIYIDQRQVGAPKRRRTFRVFMGLLRS